MNDWLEQKDNDSYTVNLGELFRLLWSRIGFLILAAVICGAAFYLGTRLFVAPLYQSSVKMYVNNQVNGETKKR